MLGGAVPGEPCRDGLCRDGLCREEPCREGLCRDGLCRGQPFREGPCRERPCRGDCGGKAAVERLLTGRFTGTRVLRELWCCSAAWPV